MDSIEFVEKYAILALGVKKEPIPSDVHIQKELFILSNVKPDIKEHFNFEKHYLGPFSRTLNNIINAPVFVKNAFGVEDNKIILQDNGKTEYNKILEGYSTNPKFKQLLILLRFIRDIYDSLSGREVMFLIYETYPAYTENSDVSDYILKNKRVRNTIINGLYSKGAITEKRYYELLEEKI